MEKIVTKCKLVASQTDSTYYTTYVFEVDPEDPFYKCSGYVMCVRYPNWQMRDLKIGEEGYLQFIEILAGYDKYWNGTKLIPYNYSNWQFVNFIEIPKNIINNNIIVD